MYSQFIFILWVCFKRATGTSRTITRAISLYAKICNIIITFKLDCCFSVCQTPFVISSTHLIVAHFVNKGTTSFWESFTYYVAWLNGNDEFDTYHPIIDNDPQSCSSCSSTTFFYQPYHRRARRMTKGNHFIRLERTSYRKTSNRKSNFSDYRR